MKKNILISVLLLISVASGFSCSVYARYLMDNIDTKYPEVRGYIKDMEPALDIKMASVTDMEIPGPNGPVPVRVFVPLSIKENAPLVMYLHGGGYVIGSYTMVDRVTRTLAHEGKCVVVSVDYALAPEHPYPVGLLDCETVFEYLSVHAAEYQSASDRIIVSGESAGANLSTVLCLKRMNEGKSLPLAQMLFSPPVGGINPDTGEIWKTKEANSKKGILTAKSMKLFGQLYLGDPVLYKNDPYVNPIMAKSFSGMPQALIVTCGNDPLCEEGQAYAEKLEQAGVIVTAKLFPGKEHAYQGKEVMTLAVEFLNSL